MKTMILRLLTCLLLTLPVFASGQDTGGAKAIFNGPPPSETSATEPEVPKGKEINTATTSVSPFNSFEFLLSLAVLSFGLLVVVFEVYLSVKQRIDPDHIMKVIILTLVITGSVVLITAGYSNNQITGVTGILGSIAGYMLGRSDWERKKTT